jgi:indole-3-glycerol phosphate synthase
VLTEPSRFDGSLEHLQQASAALAPFKVPAMRKDFLVDPYQVLEARAAGASGADQILIGINSRDLQTLEVVPERFEVLAPQLPRDWPAVAESGVASAADALRMMALGFRLALIGTALMSRDDPGQLLREILATTRTVKA